MSNRLPQVVKKSDSTPSADSWYCQRCGLNFPLVQFSTLPRRCRECCNELSAKYGIGFEFVDVLLTAVANEKWYLEKIPHFESISHKERIRILLLAGGQKIIRPSDRENQGAQRIRDLVPEMSKDWNFVSWGNLAETLNPKGQL